VSSLTEWIPFVFYGVIAVLSIAFYFYARKVSPKAKIYIILAFGISVIELVTDCFFLYQTYSLANK